MSQHSNNPQAMAKALETFAENLGVKIALRTSPGETAAPAGPNHVPNVVQPIKTLGK